VLRFRNFTSANVGYVNASDTNQPYADGGLGSCLGFSVDVSATSTLSPPVTVTTTLGGSYTH
jgi:hypothetical protein